MLSSNEEIGSITWWVSVVFVGFIVNIVSTYARPWLDRLFLSNIALWKNRSSAAKRVLAQRVDALISDDRLLRQAEHREIRASLERVRFSVFGVAFMVLGYLVQSRQPTIGRVILIAAVITMMSSIVWGWQARDRRREIEGTWSRATGYKPFP